MTILIPLNNIPQFFQITLVNTQYNFTVYWNDSQDAGWCLDIADINNTPVACGLPFVTGVDILAGLSYLGIPGSLYINTNGDTFAVPTYADLGIQSNLYFVTAVASV